jgi:hypothetical protein
MIFLHTINPIIENGSYSTKVNSSQTHLEMHGYMHFEIVKQLFELDFAPC